jgi:hypothetical protein
MDYVLDLDLDFFVWPVKLHPSRKRLPGSQYTYACEQEVRQFLEDRCHLDRVTKIPGRQLNEHIEALKVWRKWVTEGKLSQPFSVIHVDAHADLGAGTTWEPVDKLLRLSWGDRAKKSMREIGLHSGNYLFGAIAYRWLSKLTYVYPTDPASQDESPPPSDLPDSLFLGRNPSSGKIQLKGSRALSGLAPNAGTSDEPCVRFERIADRRFEFSGFTHMVVAHSRKYTPEPADHLLPVIREYFLQA